MRKVELYTRKDSDDSITSGMILYGEDYEIDPIFREWESAIPEGEYMDVEETLPEWVIFRKFPEGDVIALFPEWPYVSGDGSLIGSYMHIGQHAAASIELIHELDPANPEEYSELKDELESIGYILEVTE